MKHRRHTSPSGASSGDSGSIRRLDGAVAKLIRAFRSRRPLRGGSLIVTVFGDALTPHGASIWLTDLVRLVEPFGIDARLTRTSVFRLAREGLLTSHRLGRRSYYTLTHDGRRTFDEATRRIYSPPSDAWDGIWTWIVPLKALSMRLRRELEWHGFAPISRGIWAHPRPESAVLARLQDSLRTASPLFLRGTPEPLTGGTIALQRLVSSAWDLPMIERRYAAFLKDFQPIHDALRSVATVPPALAFEIRTLLIHEYRRLQLRDPHLPAALLPASWLARPAFELCRRLYEQVLEPSERHLIACVEGVHGKLPSCGPQLAQRFGGLQRARPGGAGGTKSG